MVLATEDTTGFFVSNPDTYTAMQISLQTEIIAQGTAVESAPDVPSYLAITSSNVYQNGPNYSGYSADGGHSWHRFGTALRYPCAPSKQCDTPAGNIAVSVRGSRQLGEDHIVIVPSLNFAPQYSHDGGRTWHVSRSFPLADDGLRLDTAPDSCKGFGEPGLHQHLLRADPFQADKFYLKWTYAPDTLYVSEDGGETWIAKKRASLPEGAFHGQLVTNGFLAKNLWYADGWEGSAAHGIYESVDGGESFRRFEAFAHAINLAIGKGSGRRPDADFTVYVYGQQSPGQPYGIFRSVDAGTSWQRIAFYPLGIYDRPVTLAASSEIFGLVVLGWNGNSFAYSTYLPR